ncbi:MAG: DUF4126 domain-containing protein [Bacteroidia bacterium]|nr:DUF4126 domain-containing protein [Bacteroidia bacterium]NNC85258.1 DUF4126 domain-containing protein [Bacteroidia bacterium]NNM15749.1 DUF4126 domain-containing protein [Bacteroidia bacterium]
MEIVLSAFLGLGLSAAVGFRIFVPFFIASIAAYTGNLTLSESFTWIGSMPAMIMFGVATIFEIGAYYIPWLDNLLDTVSTPIAVIAGSILTASTMFELDPALKWPIAIIAGGGTAGLIHGLTSSVRLGSTATTGGIANPAVSTVETGGSILLSLLAIAVPVLAFVLVLVLILFLFKKAKKLGVALFRKKSTSITNQ